MRKILKQIFKPIALLLCNYVRVYDEQGKLVGRKQIVTGDSAIRIFNVNAEDVVNYEISVNERGMKKLKGNKLILVAADKVAEISFTGVDTTKPLVLTDLEQYFIANAKEEDISQCYNHEMTYLTDEQWIRDGQEYFNNLMLGQA